MSIGGGGGCSQWISDTTDPSLIGPDNMFSAQNGLLLDGSVHSLFDSFRLAVNPDVRRFSSFFNKVFLEFHNTDFEQRGHTIVAFKGDMRNLGGRILDNSTRSGAPDHRVSDQCLRWHLHQAILTHMRGAGERPWDDYDDEWDEIGELMEIEDGPEIMETELRTRLGAYLADVR